MSGVTDVFGANRGTSFSFDGGMDEWTIWSKKFTVADFDHYRNSDNGRGYGQ